MGANHLSARIEVEGVDGDSQSDLAAEFRALRRRHLLEGIAKYPQLLVRQWAGELIAGPAGCCQPADHLLIAGIVDDRADLAQPCQN
jgi:hypothetical protein